MTRTKNLGVWMNHLDAHLIEYTLGPMSTQAVEVENSETESKPVFQDTIDIMHNNEQIAEGEYLLNLKDLLKEYEEIVLFGKDNSKVELMNILDADPLFDNIKIEMKETELLSDAEQHAFVKDYFSASHSKLNAPELTFVA